LRAISAASKVIVAAIHGPVVGIGMTMLLHCDLVVAARSARLSIPFAKLGLVPEAASTLLLPRAIGHRRAAELVLLGDPIDAETALEWGLVNRVVDDQSLLDAARELTSRIGSLPPSAIRLSKELLRDDRAGIALRIQQEGSLFLAQLRSPEFQEAGTAFLEKRSADFSRFK
jgi:enoyl-CoA hydratase/carnithine racemase